MKKKITLISILFLCLSSALLVGAIIIYSNVSINQMFNVSEHIDVDHMIINLKDLKMTRIKVFAFAVLFSMFNVFIFYTLTKKMTNQFVNRIMYIQEGIKRISKGDYSKKIIADKMKRFNEQDEIDIIVEGINKMQLEVAKREMKLTEKQEALTGLLKILSQKDDELRMSYEKYRIISEETNDGIFVIDFTDNQKVSFTKTKEVLGYDDTEITTFNEWMNLIHPNDIERGKAIFDAHFTGNIPLVEYEYRFKAKDGEYKWLYTRAKAIFGEHHEPKQLIGSNTYIHQRKMDEERIMRLAYYDQLTGLPNRYKFNVSMDERIVDYKQEYRMFACILINLDKFKKINDILGHELGDNLLRQVSDKLKGLVDEEDFLGRMGGDEFIILVDIRDHIDLNQKLEAVSSLFKYNWTVEDRSFHITASVGAAIFPQDGISRSELLKNTDVALQHSKENKKGEYIVFDSMMNHVMLERHQIENDLRKAIQNNEILVYYQPKMDHSGKRISGFEALARWIQPDGKMIRPDVFIPIAEETGIIVELGKIILERTCHKIVELNQASHYPISIAVNLSAVQFREDDIIETVREIIHNTGVDPILLGIEITESLAMEDFELVNSILKNFKKLGIQIALDDFGTGYSSLNYLKQLDIDTMKIDKSFIDDIGKETDDEVIIDSLIHIAHSLDLEVVAEGVETFRQLQYLENLNCNGYQGYYFSKPIPEYELTTKSLLDMMNNE